MLCAPCGLIYRQEPYLLRMRMPWMWRVAELEHRRRRFLPLQDLLRVYTTLLLIPAAAAAVPWMDSLLHQAVSLMRLGRTRCPASAWLSHRVSVPRCHRDPRRAHLSHQAQALLVLMLCMRVQSLGHMCPCPDALTVLSHLLSRVARIPQHHRIPRPKPRPRLPPVALTAGTSMAHYQPCNNMVLLRVRPACSSNDACVCHYGYMQDASYLGDCVSRAHLGSWILDLGCWRLYESDWPSSATSNEYECVI